MIETTNLDKILAVGDFIQITCEPPWLDGTPHTEEGIYVGLVSRAAYSLEEDPIVYLDILTRGQNDSFWFALTVVSSIRVLQKFKDALG